MAVKVETPKSFLRELETARAWKLKRHANGDWTVHVCVRVQIRLPDGRQVQGSHMVSVPCQQLGRRKSR